jgi:hypothetical protein
MATIPTKEQLEINKAHINSEKAKASAKPNQVYVCVQNKKGEMEFEFVDLKDVSYEGKPLKKTIEGMKAENENLKKEFDEKIKFLKDKMNDEIEKLKDAILTLANAVNDGETL